MMLDLIPFGGSVVSFIEFWSTETGLILVISIIIRNSWYEVVAGHGGQVESEILV